MKPRTLWILSLALCCLIFLIQQIHLHRIQIFNSQNCPQELTEALIERSSEFISGCSFPSVHLDQQSLQQVSLSKMDLSFSEFTGIEFRNANLSQVDFSNSKLRGTRILSSQFQQVNFTGANLKNIVVLQSSLRNCRFQGADLSNARFILSSLAGSRFDSKTLLPFTHQDAVDRGMIFDP